MTSNDPVPRPKGWSKQRKTPKPNPFVEDCTNKKPVILSDNVKLQPQDYTYSSIHDGLALARNATGDHQDWEWLNCSGKWQPGFHFMGPYIYKGEIGDEPVSLDEARAIAKKLGGTIDGAVASEEEVRAMQAEWEAEYGD